MKPHAHIFLSSLKINIISIVRRDSTLYLQKHQKEFNIWQKKEELGNCGANHTGGIKKEKTIRSRQKAILEIAEQII
jgi:hypothetical protein